MTHSHESSQQRSWHSQRDLETEHRLTRLEVTRDMHEASLRDHGGKIDQQDVWNKGFTLALLGLASGLAHAKAGEVVSFMIDLLRGLKP